jgi:hypothetical protein
VHRPVSEQREDRGANVTTSAATAAAGSAAPAATTTGSETEAGSENGSETAGAEATDAGTEAAVAAVLADVFAEVMTGLPATFVQCTPILGTEAATETEAGAAIEWVLWGCEWGVHVCGSPSTGNAECASDTLTIYRKLS